MTLEAYFRKDHSASIPTNTATEVASIYTTFISDLKKSMADPAASSHAYLCSLIGST